MGKGTSPSLDLTFPPTGLSENLGGMERGRGGKGERKGWGDQLPYFPPLASASNTTLDGGYAGLLLFNECYTDIYILILTVNIRGLMCCYNVQGRIMVYIWHIFCQFRHTLKLSLILYCVLNATTM